MGNLASHLELHGSIVLTVSLIIAGLFLYSSILNKTNQAAWHLVEADGSGRGVMLLALIIRARRGERGLRYGARILTGLYILRAIFPAPPVSHIGLV